MNRRLWVAITAVAVVDVLWLARVGMRVDQNGLVHLLAGVAVLGTVACFYAATRRSDSLACAANSAAQFLAFSAAGVVLSYLVTTTQVPLLDAVLLQADRAIGFDWNGWAEWVRARPWLHGTLALAYAALVPETLLCLLYLGTRKAADEFLCLYLVTGLVTIAVSGVVPALGHLPGEPQVPQVLALRAGALTVIPLSQPAGLITFPSFHTGLALVVAYALRRTAMRWPAVVLAGLIVASVPTEGGHYLVDALGGGLTVLIAAVVSRRIFADGERRGDRSARVHRQRSPASEPLAPDF